MRSALLRCALAAVIVSTASATQAQSPVSSPTDLLSAVKKKHAKAHSAQSRPAGGQIACTVLGCHPIPPQCHPGTGYTLDGIPTGYDVIICP